MKKVLSCGPSAVRGSGRVARRLSAHAPPLPPQALKVRVEVFSNGMPLLVMGEENGGGAARTLRLAFHRHAFGLGEHYNSVGPRDGAVSGGGADSDDD